MLVWRFVQPMLTHTIEIWMTLFSKKYPPHRWSTERLSLLHVGLCYGICMCVVRTVTECRTQFSASVRHTAINSKCLYVCAFLMHIFQSNDDNGINSNRTYKLMDLKRLQIIWNIFKLHHKKYLIGQHKFQLIINCYETLKVGFVLEIVQNFNEANAIKSQQMARYKY